MRDKGKMDGFLYADGEKHQNTSRCLEGNRNQPMTGQKVWSSFMVFCEVQSCWSFGSSGSAEGCLCAREQRANKCVCMKICTGMCSDQVRLWASEYL